MYMELKSRLNCLTKCYQMLNEAEGVNVSMNIPESAIKQKGLSE